MTDSVGATPSARTTRIREWTALAVFLVLYGLAYMDRQIITLLVDPIRKDLGASDFEISLLQGAAFVIFFTLCALPIGWAVDRYPRRWIVYFGITIWSIFAAAGGLAHTYWQLLLARCGVGAGEATLGPSAYSMISDIFPRERLAGAMAIFSTGAIVGGSIALALGGFLVHAAEGVDHYTLPLIGDVRPWQFVLIATGAPGVLLAFLIFLVTEPARRDKLHAEKKAAPISAMFAFLRAGRGFYLAHFIGFSAFGLMAAGYAAWAPTYFMRTFDWPVDRAGLVLGTQTLVFSSAGMLFSGYFVDHLFRKGVTDAHLRYYLWAIVAFGGAGITAMMSSDIVVVLVCLSVVKFITAFIAVAAAAIQITTPNEYRGQISALFLFVYNIVGYGIGPSMMAGISDFTIGDDKQIGLAMGITFAIFAPVVFISFWIGMSRMRKAVKNAESWAGR